MNSADDSVNTSPSAVSVPSTGFKITDGKGFHITLSNGYTLSVQFGYANYGDNYDVRREELAELARTHGQITSSQAEIAMWGADRKYFVFDEDGARNYSSGVEGYLSPDQVFRQLTLMADLPASQVESFETAQSSIHPASEPNQKVSS